MTVVSPFLTFPRISWWMQVMNADTVLLDKAEHYEKMTGRNRYDISGSSNKILLSVPLTHGRNQHIPMQDVLIYNTVNWQVQHWRTLVSVYSRTPYFEHYEPSLQRLFETAFTHLTEFNKAGIQWVMQQMRLKFQLQETNEYVKEYPAEITDLRDTKKEVLLPPPVYYQIFEDRIGFLPDLSILDLLFSEGPAAVRLLM